MGWLRGICFCAGALLSISTLAEAQPSGGVRFMEPHTVEGLAIGTPVAPNSWQYKRFNCTPSTQYANSTWCTFSETNGDVSTALTILHLYDNIVTYINKQLSPALFTNSEIDREIARLSRQFNSSAHIYHSPTRRGLTGGIANMRALGVRSIDVDVSGLSRRTEVPALRQRLRCGAGWPSDVRPDWSQHRAQGRGL